MSIEAIARNKVFQGDIVQEPKDTGFHSHHRRMLSITMRCITDETFCPLGGAYSSTHERSRDDIEQWKQISQRSFYSSSTATLPPTSRLSGASKIWRSDMAMPA